MFGQLEIKYLGHIISHLGVSADQSKIQAMLEWPTPTSVKELRGVPWPYEVLYTICAGLCKLARPLTERLRKNNFFWDEATEQPSNNFRLKWYPYPF